MLSVCIFAQGGTTDKKIVTFRFVPGEDMFYIPQEGNDVQLEMLYKFVDEYRAEITSGRMPVYVDGYSASMNAAAQNRKLAFVRANRVKSELIMRKGLLEKHFITKNHTTAYTGADGVSHKDLVVVTLHIPVKVAEEPRRQEPAPAPRPEPKPEPQPVAQPDLYTETLPELPETPIWDIAILNSPYCFAVRTNLLYDAFLLPTLGVEWRASRSVGIKLDGSYSHWGDEHGRVQKMWLVSPEVRWYLLDSKRFYVGAGANIGEANIYKGMLGSLLSKDTGYQGKFYGGGLTVGYQLRLNSSLSLDFNLGLGCTRFEYDTFRVVDQVRVYRTENLTKNLWGPTQAGINLIWTIGK